MQIIGDMMYTIVDPRIDFEVAGIDPVARYSGGGSGSSGPTAEAIGRFGCSLMLFGASLFAEFIANDRPLLVRYDNAWAYVPVLRDYSGDAFGPDFLPTDADYSTDPELRYAIEAKGWMVWPPMPLFLRHHASRRSQRSAARAAELAQSFGYRRSGARCTGSRDLRVSSVRVVRIHSDGLDLGRRSHRRRTARILRRASTDLELLANASSKSGAVCRSFTCSSYWAA